MLLGSWVKPLVRLFAAISLLLYRKAEAINKTMMASEYFWMRHLQARILAGRDIDRNVVVERLLEIEHFFCDLHDDSHRMTVFMCYAFIEAHCGSSDNRISALLNKAEEISLSRERFDRTGALIRILLYRRYLLNQPKLVTAVAQASDLVRGRQPH